jgi:hypothetical protein
MDLVFILVVAALYLTTHALTALIARLGERE